MGWRLDTKPAPILYVGPSKEFNEKQMEPRVMGLLDEAPTLASKVLRGKQMTKTRKVVNGVPLRLAHAGSSTALKSDPAALALVDEYDEMLANVKGQGNPLALVEARGFTYADFSCAVVSTPSVGASDTYVDLESGLEFWKVVPPEDIESPIWRLWQEGTRYHWSWPCPHCRQYFIPRFKLLRWPEKATPSEARQNAWIDCPNCGAEIRNENKADMNARGVHVAPGQSVSDQGVITGEPPDSSTVSFWISGLASPFVTWGERAEMFLKAVNSGDQMMIQTAINAGFGEMWAPSGGDVPEPTEVASRRLPYRMGDTPSQATVPEQVQLLTAGVDVQKNRLYYVVRGWGTRATSWLVHHGEIWGDTSEPAVWNDLTSLLETDFSGLYIRLMFVDSGYRPGKPDEGPEHIVYAFARQHVRRVRAIKGRDSLRTPLQVSRIEVTPQGKQAKYGLELVHLNTDWCKSWVHERIRWPSDQPGAWFLPEDSTDDYCAQVVSEARMRRPSGRAVWVRKSKDNHYFDCEAMAYAAGLMLNVQRIETPAPERMKPSAREKTEDRPRRGAGASDYLDDVPEDFI